MAVAREHVFAIDTCTFPFIEHIRALVVFLC